MVIRDFQVSFIDAYGNEIMGKDELLDLTECDQAEQVACELYHSLGFYKAARTLLDQAENTQSRYFEILAMRILEELRKIHLNYVGLDRNSLANVEENLFNVYSFSELGF